MNNPTINDKLPERCVEAATLARTSLLDYAYRVVIGKVTLYELEKISMHSDQMKRLCQAALCPSDGSTLTYQQIEDALPLRIEENDVFVSCRTHLCHLCRLIESEVCNVQGIVFVLR